MKDIFAGTSKWCRSCASKKKQARRSPEERKAAAKKASLVAAKLLAERVDEYEVKYGSQLKEVLAVAVNAKQRCQNPRNKAYPDYGGRGIEFRFVSVRAAAEWVLDNLGTRPHDCSIDRIDNNRHYEPGNLRWATRSEQGQNKRAYRRTAKGERIRVLQELRPDLTYETLRIWIKQGATDEEITNRRRHARTGV